MQKDTNVCVKEFRITGLWDSKDFVWKLKEDVNVLAGINGSGKSTIIRLLYSIITRDRSIFHYWPRILSGSVTYNNKEKSYNPKSLDFSTIDWNDSTLKDVKEKLLNVFSELEKISTDNDFKEKLLPYYFKFSEIKEDKFSLDNPFGRNVYFINSLDKSLVDSESITKLTDNNVKTELDYQLFLLQRKYIDYRLKLAQQFSEFLEKTNPEEFLSKLNDLNNPNVFFLGLIDDLFKNTGKTTNKTASGISFLLEGKELSIYQLSSGEKQMLIILLTMLVQNFEPSLVILDEPEISLHSDWQRKLISVMRKINPNAQIIIATHSPTLIMDGWLDNVFEISDLMSYSPKTK